MTEKQKFFALLALVCEKMPYYAVDSAVRAGLAAEYGKKEALKRLHNVKQGRLVCLADLVALVRHSLPDFDIPAHLLPEVAHLLPEVAAQEAVA